MLLLAMVACKPISPAGYHGPVAPDASWRGLDPPNEAWMMCLADEDCGVAEVGCCDHCNGGRAVPARRDHIADVERTYRDPCDEDACGAVTCRGSEPVCRIGRCVLEAGTHTD